MPQADNAKQPRERRPRGDDPSQVADHLTEQHGAKGAMDTASAGIATAQSEGDNYRLSIWREVRRILRNRPVEPVEEKSD
jgi:hypothetical protein